MFWYIIPNGVLSVLGLGWNNMTSFLVGLSDIGIQSVIRNDCLK